jgi:hypothetical protein
MACSGRSASPRNTAAAPPSCTSLADVTALGAVDPHDPHASNNYNFTVQCDIGRFRIEGSYATSTGVALDVIHELDGRQRVASTIADCGSDPWLSGTRCKKRPGSDRIVVDRSLIADFHLDSTQYPVSAALLTPDLRAELKKALDAFRVQAAAKDPCSQANLAAVIQNPREGQLFRDSVPVVVRRDNETCDRDARKFDLQWQWLPPVGDSKVGWQDRDVLATLDLAALPTGARISAGKLGIGTWRVRARLSGHPEAAWSEWVSFGVAPQAQ